MAARGSNRRDFLKMAGAGAAAMALPMNAHGTAGEKGMNRKNILFIHTDSWDGRVLGCMGHPAMKRATPNLDALAQRGVLFRNAYSNNPICCPSRSSMWSGLYTHHCEGWNNYKGIEKDDPTFRTRLDSAGYRTQTFGKEDYLSGAHTIRARVSAWTRSANVTRPQYRMPGPTVLDNDEKRVHARDWQDVDRGIAWMEKAAEAGDKPFWLYLGIRQPHPAFTTSRRYLDLIDEADVTIPPEDESGHPVMAYQRAVKNWMHGFSEDTVRLVRRIYCAMCAEVDAMVGEVLAALDRLGLTDSTYVIFGSDHGENNMEHRQFYKSNMYESSAHIPLIIAGPGVRQGAGVETPVSLIDIYPTLMDMAETACPKGLDGHSLMPLLAGESSGRPAWAFSEYHDSSCNTGAFMLRHGDWKYIAYAGYPPQLFNLKDDPEEVCNLAEARPEVVREMDTLLRSVVDYEEADARAKAYDRAAFRQWRDETKAAGEYEDLMARVFSGWDDLEPEDIQPWTDEEEEALAKWMEG